MKRKITLTCKMKKKGFLGIPYTITEKKTVEVDEELYEHLKAQEESKKKSKSKKTKDKQPQPYSIEEMMFYDDLFGD